MTFSKNLKVTAVAAALLCCLEGPAFAYLDPGTGSIILQAIVAGVASSLFVVKVYWNKFKAIFGFATPNTEADESDIQK